MNIKTIHVASIYSFMHYGDIERVNAMSPAHWPSRIKGAG